ncbi:putative lipoprotein [Teredinibacter turnerae T7901]|uniref:Lipoprotein n=1 Tax=Teredinibacter turnerae (strain ATCC 39867 / T7901) TaxID=377629 RepID=C5BRX5_TERTT|nr:putative lipoprotein [Teredinibacter turnerae T7901]
MKTLFRIAIIVGCFLLAIACYVFGIPYGGIAFFLLGLIFEALFWIGIFKKKKNLV